jgi:DNA end-binding protein Ku
MAPDDDGAADVFAVLRAAFAKTGKVALSRMVIGRRERAVAITRMGRGLVVHTLHEARDINDSIPEVEPEEDMVALATQLIDRQSGQYDPAADNEDRYETRLREVIDARLRGEGVTPQAAVEDDTSNVIDLMALLKKSLSGSKAPAKPKPAGKKKPVGKATPARRKAS